MTILLYIIYIIICIGVFICFMMDSHTTTIRLSYIEYVIIALLLSIIAPIGLVIIVIGYPFYGLHCLLHRHDVKPINPECDDDEPQGFDYEEHEDWCDGNTEYEDE